MRGDNGREDGQERRIERGEKEERVVELEGAGLVQDLISS